MLQPTGAKPFLTSLADGRRQGDGLGARVQRREEFRGVSQINVGLVFGFGRAAALLTRGSWAPDARLAGVVTAAQAAVSVLIFNLIVH